MPTAGGMQHGVGDDGCLGGQGFERGKPAVFGVVKRAQVDAVEEFLSPRCGWVGSNAVA